MTEDHNIIKGLLWGSILSVPLWLSIFGWVKVLKALL